MTIRKVFPVLFLTWRDDDDDDDDDDSSSSSDSWPLALCFPSLELCREQWIIFKGRWAFCYLSSCWVSSGEDCAQTTLRIVYSYWRCWYFIISMFYKMVNTIFMTFCRCISSKKCTKFYHAFLKIRSDFLHEQTKHNLHWITKTMFDKLITKQGAMLEPSCRHW